MANRFQQFAPQQTAPAAPGGNRFAQFSTPEMRPGFMSFANRGIANVLGAPVDVVNLGLRQIGLGTEQPFLGSESIKAGMGAIGIETAPADMQPETLAESVAAGAGEAAGALVPFAKGAQALQAGGRIAKGVGETMLRPFIKTPVAGVTAEIAAGAGSGAGEHIASNIAPDNPAAPAVGALLGGLGGGAGSVVAQWATGIPLARRGINAIRATVTPFTTKGAMPRASRRVRELSADPAREAAALDEPSIGGLTPAQQTGSERLMALERAVLDKDAMLDDKFKRQTTEATQRLRQAMREPAGTATAEDLTSFVEQRRNYTLFLLDTRIRQAGEAAEQRIARLAPERRTAESAAIVRAEIEAAHRAARGQERQLWDAVPRDVEVPTDTVRAAWQREMADLPRAQLEDMPREASRVLDPDSNRRLGEVDTVGELHGLYSKMREVARKQRAKGNRNKARIADNIADAAMADLSAGEGDIVQDAVAFSRQVNQTFRRGAVGDILAPSSEGGAAVPPASTLDVSVGRGVDTARAVSTDEIIAATGTDATREAIEDYVKRRFADAAIRNNQFGAQRAEDFVRNNAELLERFPALRDQMADATQAQRLAERTAATAGGRRTALSDQKRSATANIVAARPDEEFDAILKSRSPRTEARKIRATAEKDETGVALRGLKGSFVDYLIRRATTGQVDEAGESILSGRKLQNLLNDPKIKSASTEILTVGEQKRMQKIIQELRNVETSQRRLPAVGDVMEDTPAKMIDYLGRVLAARAGARAGAGSSGASLLTASFASKRMKDFLNRMTNNRAEALIRDAIQDKELFQTLLMGVDTPRKARRVENRLVAWLEGYTGTVVADQAAAPETTSQERP